ncbi:ribosomal L18p/L5e [Helicosporidium sp. ATCC 50920]|nr:ribosomal L18p/L5e [Helicosporidium sp. ATCC 50920]|eukprot:KDD76608.1 ribosomal L18p/L5e [Helicosporidium sp. ATCC 50920]
MPAMKVVKNSSYYSRYQVKYRRRREGKTDYRARLRLVTQDKNKYNTPKYRMVVRFTNKDIVCQLAYSTLAGDVVVASAYSHELPKYGLTVGLTNYAAAYATGLLLARRVLSKYNLAKAYAGNTEDVGEDYNVEEIEGEKRPFVALLDTGLKRTSTGSKVFAALKGALDGGLDVPHSEKRFVGYSRESKSLDSDVLRKYIFGGHVGEYMESMAEEDEEKFKRHFSCYIKAGLEADGLEALYTKVHAAIRASPEAAKKSRSKPAKAGSWKTPKSTYEERKERLKAKLAELMA